MVDVGDVPNGSRGVSREVAQEGWAVPFAPGRAADANVSEGRGFESHPSGRVACCDANRPNVPSETGVCRLGGDICPNKPLRNGLSCA